MGYIIWGHKELDTTEQLTLRLRYQRQARVSQALVQQEEEVLETIGGLKAPPHNLRAPSQLYSVLHLQIKDD